MARRSATGIPVASKETTTLTTKGKHMATGDRPTYNLRIKDGETFKDVGAAWDAAKGFTLRLKEPVPANTTIYMLKNTPREAAKPKAG
jgi:hypothetical protein